jgi:hypothetical protein
MEKFELIIAPFSANQVEAINKYQDNDFVHPLTCGNNRTDENHTDGEGILKATKDGLICPFCDYKQNNVPGLVIELADYHPLAEFEIN